MTFIRKEESFIQLLELPHGWTAHGPAADTDELSLIFAVFDVVEFERDGFVHEGRQQFWQVSFSPLPILPLQEAPEYGAAGFGLLQCTIFASLWRHLFLL